MVGEAVDHDLNQWIEDTSSLVLDVEMRPMISNSRIEDGEEVRDFTLFIMATYMAEADWLKLQQNLLQNSQVYPGEGLNTTKTRIPLTDEQARAMGAKPAMIGEPPPEPEPRAVNTHSARMPEPVPQARDIPLVPDPLTERLPAGQRKLRFGGAFFAIPNDLMSPEDSGPPPPPLLAPPLDLKLFGDLFVIEGATPDGRPAPSDKWRTRRQVGEPETSSRRRRPVEDGAVPPDSGEQGVGGTP